MNILRSHAPRRRPARGRALALALALWLAIALAPSPGLAQASGTAQAGTAQPLFAVQIRTGPRWDPAKPAHEQALFGEHSANLRRLREAGQLLLGARYADIGLVVLAAESEAAARAMMDRDPSIAAGVFRYDVHSFNVFYPGSVPPEAALPD